MPAKKATKNVTEAAKKAPAKKAAKKAAAKTATVAKKSAPAKKAAAKPAAKPGVEAIARAAYMNYLHRVANGLPGDSHSDWVEAERSLGA